MPVLFGPGLLKDPWCKSEEPPAETDPGFLEHSIFEPIPEREDEQVMPVEADAERPALNPSVNDKTMEEDAPPPEYPESLEFWSSGLYRQCPVRFDLSAIRTYFEEQKTAYLAHAKSLDDYTYLNEWELDKYVYSQALSKTYSKAWYEFHINEAIDFVTSKVSVIGNSEKGGERLVYLRSIIEYSARAGRLVEQYYWKFIFEKKAIAGTKLSKGGKAGAALTAAKAKEEHARWQAEADRIWKADPSKTKAVVAKSVKRRLKIDQGIKQIVRVLKRP